MGLRNRTFTDNQFIQAVKNSYSIAQVLRSLSLSIHGGANYRTFKILAKRLNVNHDHFTGCGHLKGKTHSWGKTIPLCEILIKDSSYTNTTNIKSKIIKANLIEEKCNICGILTWQNKKLSLHLDHINGINNDHRFKNLRLLCPNCHSLTPTYCGRNKKKKKKFLKSPLPKKQNPICLNCKKSINRKAIRCKSCAGKYVQKTKINWPETQQLIEMVKQLSYTKIAQKLGVSDNAIRKRIKRHP